MLGRKIFAVYSILSIVHCRLQLLTPEELARRKLTGTLKTTALGPKLLQWLQLPGKDVPVQVCNTTFNKELFQIIYSTLHDVEFFQDFMAITDKTFTVELDSPLFSAPSTLHIPAPADDIPGHAGEHLCEKAM